MKPVALRTPTDAALNCLMTLVAIILVAGLAMAASQFPFMQSLGLSSLALGIVAGLVIGHIVPELVQRPQVHSGLCLAKTTVLRWGIVLFGFQIMLQDLVILGWPAFVVSAVMLSATLALTVFLGLRYFGIERNTVWLIAAGSSVCGAAAVLAGNSVVRGRDDQVATALSTVILFGTLGMFLFPVVHHTLDLNELAAALWIGSSLHEVAQVVAAGSMVSEGATESALLVKMVRVMLLGVVLVVMQGALHSSGNNSGTGIRSALRLPWYIVVFLLAVVINSTGWLPAAGAEFLGQAGVFLMTMAMVALGATTHWRSVARAGIRPMLLGSVVFGFLTIGGLALSYALVH